MMPTSSRAWRWWIVHIKGTPAPTIGYVEAADAETAIKNAIKEFKITSVQLQQHLVAERIKQKRTERPTGLAQHRNVRRFFGSWREVNSNSRRAFEACPDRRDHRRNKSIIHPVKLALCVGQAAEVPHLLGL